MDLLNQLARIVFPVAVVTIMFCLGLGLRAADFVDLARRPRLLAVGAACQLALLPLIAFAVARVFGLSTPLTAGLLLIAACPVSAPTNLLARLSRGNVAGALALTALTAPAAAVTIPLVLALSGYRSTSPGSGGPSADVLLWPTSFGVAGLVAIPVAMGMVTRAALPLSSVERVQRRAIHVAVAAFAVGFAFVVAASWYQIPRSFREVGTAALVLNLAGIAGAWLITTTCGLTPVERLVVVLTSSTRQFAIAAFVALTLYRDALLLLPAIAYCLLMWVTAMSSVAVARRAELRAATTRTPAGADGPTPKVQFHHDLIAR